MMVVAACYLNRPLGLKYVLQYFCGPFGSPSATTMERTFSKGHFAALTIAIRRTKGYREIALRPPLSLSLPRRPDGSPGRAT